MKNLVFYIFTLTLLSCTEPEPEGNKYYLHLHIEQQEHIGTRYLPKTEMDSMKAINDSVAYLHGAAYLLAEEKALHKMKAEGLGVYKRVKGFTVTDSMRTDIKPNLNPSYIQRMDMFIEKKRKDIWMSSIEND